MSAKCKKIIGRIIPMNELECGEIGEIQDGIHLGMLVMKNFDFPDWHDCECANCPELKKEFPDCACDEAGPIYCPHQCDPCPMKDICDVPKNPKHYICAEICEGCPEMDICLAWKGE